MNPQWARDIRDDCVNYGVAYFHKQWGSYHSNPLVFEESMSVADAKSIDGVENGKGGGLIDGVLWRQFPDTRTAIPPVTDSHLRTATSHVIGSSSIA